MASTGPDSACQLNVKTFVALYSKASRQLQSCTDEPIHITALIITTDTRSVCLVVRALAATDDGCPAGILGLYPKSVAALLLVCVAHRQSARQPPPAPILAWMDWLPSTSS